MSNLNVLPAPSDVVELDFFQLVTRALTLAKTARPDIDWDSKAGLERLLVEGSSALTSKVSALTNNNAREHFFGTSFLRQSAFRQCKRTGYRPATPAAATTTVTFTVVGGALAAAVLLPAGSTVRTGDVQEPVVFQLLEAATIEPGGSPEKVDGTVENSSNAVYVFESNGKPNQSVRLPIAPYLDGSIVVTTGVDEWDEQQRNLILSHGTDRHFWVDIDAADLGIVHFGDNTNGAVPTGLVTIAYKYGGGRVGNVAPGAITLLDGSFTDTLGNPVQIAVTNTERVDNGEDHESTASIKLRAPLAAQTPRVSVSRNDYETTATGVPGVARALLLTRNEDEFVPRNRGFLFIVPNEGGPPSQELIDDVAARFEDEVTVGDPTLVMPPIGDRPKTVSFQLEVRAPTYKTVDVTARIWLRQGAVSTRVRLAVEAALTEFFAIEVDAQTIDPKLPPGLIPNPRIDFGARLIDAQGQPRDRLAYSDVYNVVRDTAGVLEIGDAPGDFMLNGDALNVTLGKPEFPKLGTVVLINAKTNAQI
jgi:uncharacterized phage protein gp47/JayE